MSIRDLCRDWMVSLRHILT